MLSLRPFERGPDRRRVGPDVSILEEDPFPRRGPGPVPTRPVLPHPPGGQRRRVHPLHPRGTAVDHFPGPVGRAVLNHDDLQVRVVLRQEVVQRGRQVELLVARGDHHADPGQGLGGGGRWRGVQSGHLGGEEQREPVVQEHGDRSGYEEELDPERDHHPA